MINKYKNYIMPTYAPPEIFFEKGNGVYLYDQQGNKYLDFIAGIAVNCLGYKHPKLTKAIKEQTEKILHISNLFPIKEQIQLAETLSNEFGGAKSFFCNSGAEANEGAIKLARKYAKKVLNSDKYEFITMNKSFHGRTLATVTATGQEKYQKDLSPLPQGFKYAEFGNIDSIKAQITAKTCAIIIEPIQGEGGINKAPKSFWEDLQATCKTNQILLIMDEVQTGIGRTGKMFGHQLFDIKPDIMTLAKGLGGGVPIGAIVAKPDVANAFSPGDHAATFGGNYLACKSALTVINTINNDKLLENVNQIGSFIKNELNTLKKKYPFIKEVRGEGLMIGCEIDESINCQQIIQKALEQKLIINCIGGKVIRIAPPLILTKSQAQEGLKILEKIFSNI